MADPFAAVAIGATVAGTGLQTAGALEKSRGAAAGYQFQEAQNKQKAASARTAADQTDVAYRENLATTLGNIGAIRAAAGVDPSSPTTDAIMEHETTISDRNRMIKVANLDTQASAYDKGADYDAWAAGNALDVGYLDAAGTLVKGIGSAGYMGTKGSSGGTSLAQQLADGTRDI